MRDTHNSTSEESTTRGPATPTLAILALALLGVAGFAIARALYLPAANCCYQVTIADGVAPRTDPARAAALARHYLDQQTPELAAPDLYHSW